MSEEYDLDIVLRPVWPLALRQSDFFERNHPNWLGYTMRDMIRVAQFHGIPFGTPRPDPIIPNMKTRERSEEHTSELQSLMRLSYAVFCLKKKNQIRDQNQT